MNGEQPGRVKAVTKAAEILHCFAPRTQVLSTRSLSRITGMPRSTIHALCVTLCDSGLLQEVPGRGYALGLGLVDLGGQVLHRHSLIEAAEGVTQELLIVDGTWALIGQLVDGWIVYLSRYMSAHHERVNSRTGLRAPAHRTACGKAALSRLDDDEIVRRVETACEAERMGTPDFATLLPELRRARTRGYVFNSDWRPGRAALGAALIDPSGSVVGGVAVGGPIGTFTPAVMKTAVRRLSSVAARIGDRLPVTLAPGAATAAGDRLGTLSA